MSPPVTEEKRTPDRSEFAKSRIAFWMRVLFLLVAIGSLTLLSGNWVNATLSIWSRSVSVGFVNAELDAPGIYRIQMTFPVDQNRIFSSRIGLLDVQQAKFLRTPKTKSRWRKRPDCGVVANFGNARGPSFLLDSLRGYFESAGLPRG
jgi:hypothetical protein